ncbi:MAG: hypothetical protein ABL977_03845 [Candidatus Eisenbacteria bacterium]
MRRWLALLMFALFVAHPAEAQLPLGATAPAYAKSLLGGGTLTNTTHSGKVVVMFMLGYG